MRFVVIEGLDGAGTTTQTQRLAAHLRRQGVAVVATCEPSPGPVGRLIRASLARAPEAPDLQVLPWLFAADRADHLHRTVEPALERGERVISDRYVASSLAYQSMVLPLDEVFALNRTFRIPDTTYFLRVPARVALARIAQRGAPREVFEDAERLTRIGAAYDEAIALLERHGHRVVTLDGAAPADEVFEEILSDLRP